MPTADAMTAVVHAYVDAFARGDAAAAAALFAPDATVEDPVGSPPVRGHEAIAEFFTRSMATGAKLHLDGPIRVAATHVAFAMQVRLDWDGRTTTIDVIDVFAIDDAGKITAMTAYFGPTNMAAAP